MNTVQNSQPLVEFTKSASDLLLRMKESGDPVALTVDGKVELVVQDAEAYQKLLDQVEEARALEAARQGLADREVGRTISLDEFKEHVRRKHGISV